MALLLGMTVCLTAISETYAASRPQPNASVIVAEDLTQEADCRRSIDGGPEYPYPAGSVVYVRETTYAEVIARQLKYWVIFSGNRQQDEAAALRLITAGSKSSLPVTTQSCTYGTRDIYQSYLYVPSDSQSTRIGFNLFYTRNTNCSVSGVSDRNRVQSVGTSTDPGHNPASVYWDASCSNGGNNCAVRHFFIGSSWTSYFVVPDSSVGSQYRNISLTSSNCYVGGRRCGNPYGFYTFD